MAGNPLSRGWRPAQRVGHHVSAIVSDVEFWIVLVVWTVHFVFLKSPYPLNYDSVNLALAIEDNFDISIHQPQPPGFLFQVLTGRIVHGVVPDPFIVLEIQGLICLAIMLLFLRTAPRRKPGHLMLCATTPLFLFFTGAPVMQSVSAAFGALIAWCVVWSITNNKNVPVLLAGVLALGTGFRFDVLMTLGPVVLLVMVMSRPSFKQWLLSAAVFIVITVSWYVPTSAMSGWVSPLRMTMEMQRQFTAGISVISGGSWFENARCAIRFLLYFPGVFGLGGCIAFFMLFRRSSPPYTRIALAATVPFFLIGILLYMPLPQYYAPLAGFCIALALLTHRLPASRAFTGACIVVNLLFFWLAPRPIEPAGSFHDRALATNIAKQVSFVGANGAAVLRYNKELMQNAESACASCGRFYAPLMWDRLWLYLADRRWHNRLTHSRDSADCVIEPVEGPHVGGKGIFREVRIERIRPCADQ